MPTEGKKVRYTEFIILLSIIKGCVDMNSYWFEKSEMRVSFCILNSKFELSTPLVLSFSDTFKDEY